MNLKKLMANNAAGKLDRDADKRLEGKGRKVIFGSQPVPAELQKKN